MKRTWIVPLVAVALLGALAPGVATAQTAASIDASPEEDSNVVTTGHTVVATVRDAAGDPDPGEQVFWRKQGVGRIVSAESTTDANGEARAITTSPQVGDQFITASLDRQSGACTEPPTRCDTVVKHWTARPAGANANECSGGAFALGAPAPIGQQANIPNDESPCPAEGEPPVEEEEEVIGVPANPLLDAGVLTASRTYTSDGSTTRASAADVTIFPLGLRIEALGSVASSQCSPQHVATQELSGGIVRITDANTGLVIFEGEAPPNTTIPLPLATIVLNEQQSSVGPELPGETQDRHAEGSVNAVHITLLPPSPGIEIIIAHAESDVTCAQQALTIRTEPEEQTVVLPRKAVVTAYVQDTAGRPVEGEPVSWSLEGDAFFHRMDTITDARGVAKATIGGNSPGDVVVTASIDPARSGCGGPGGACSDSSLIHFVA
jgi:hypothetical protein